MGKGSRNRGIRAGALGLASAEGRPELARPFARSVRRALARRHAGFEIGALWQRTLGIRDVAPDGRRWVLRRRPR